MKKLTNTQIKNIRAEICNKSGKINGSMELLLSQGIAKLMKGYTLHYMNEGSRGKKAYPTKTLEVAAEIVELMGYEVNHENDAPRGGICGDHFIKAGRPVKFSWDEFKALIEK